MVVLQGMANSDEAAGDPPEERIEDQPGPSSEVTSEGFVNAPVDVAGLPAVDEEDFESLDPNFLRVRLIGDAIFAGVVVVAAAVVAVLVPWWWLPLLVGLGLLVLTALVAWLQRLEVEHLGYLVRDKDFSYRRGVISREVTTVPFARVQHVSIDRGPLARSFGMATLQMRTAGDGLTIPGMNHETAVKLKELVADRAGTRADDELTELPLGDSEPTEPSPAASEPIAPPPLDPVGPGPVIPDPPPTGDPQP